MIWLHFQEITFPSRLILFIAFLFQTSQAYAQCGIPIAAFPYHEDFELSQGGWVSGGAGNDWAWGMPNKPTINAAGSGQNCWVTGGLTGSFYNLGQRSFVESPCFDFTLLPHPYIHFKIWWESEQQYDGANLQYSLNNGSTWVNVGTSNDPTDCLNDNWFNTPSITNLTTLANPRQGWTGNIQPGSGSCQGGNGSNGWVIAKHCMPSLAGKPSVKFRFAFGTGTTCNNFDGIAFDDVYIENAPPIPANFNSVCNGNNAYIFTDLSTNCPDSWNWSFGDPASGASNISMAQNPSHTFSGPGLYTVSLQVSSVCSGVSTVSFPVEVVGVDAISAPPSCFGGKDGTISVQLNPSGGSPSYAWNTVPPQSGPVAKNLVAGNYTVSVAGAGICPFTATIALSDPDPSQVPTGLIQANPDTTIAFENSVALTGIISDPGRIISYKWEPAMYLDCDTCLNTLASPRQTITYTLIAVDTNGCIISDALEIRVLQGSVYIPNVFRPSSEGSNGRFTVFARADVESVELLQIYDRWGSLIFENRNFQASDAAFGWDGKANGKDAAAGAYLYVAKVKYLGGSSVLFKGDVTVVR